MRRLKNILQSRYFFKIISIILVCYSIWVSNFIQHQSKYSQKETEVTGTIIKYQIDGNQLKVYLKAKEKIIIYYYFTTEEEKKLYEESLQLGDEIKVTGVFDEASNNTIPNGFNYKKYLKYHKIHYLMQAKVIIKQKNNTSILYYIKNRIIKRIDKIDKTGYLHTFILGDKSFLGEDSLANYRNNGISHLFSISGMHVGLIVGILMFFLNKVSYNSYYKYSIIIPVLLFYLFLTDFSASITRTTIMFFISVIIKCFKLKLKDIDVMLFTLSVAIIINPFIIWEVGFQFSYSISLALVLLKSGIKKIKRRFFKSLYISFLCFMVSFPICIYYFYQVNFLSIIWNLIMIPFVSIVVFPMSLLVFLFPKIYSIYLVVIACLEQLNKFISTIQIFEIIFKKPSILLIFVYYMAIILTCYQKKYFLILGVIMLCHWFYPYLDNQFVMTVLDVGQGDSILIKLPHNKGNILIDTGGKSSIKQEEWQKKNKTSSITSNNIIPYLKSLGISKLDHLILTHGDYDHMGEASKLVENFKVNNVIFNKGEYNTLETELIKLLTKKKINYVQSQKNLKIDQYIFYFLNQTIYEDENQNSNIIYFKYNDYSFLLQGDAYTKQEQEIVSNYTIQNLTFLKVGHHGSDTSSSQVFTSKINPKYSLISVGLNNRYHHPSSEVLRRLNRSVIYRTDRDGSIVIQINNTLKITTYTP